jgi:hypothetical protein
MWLLETEGPAGSRQSKEAPRSMIPVLKKKKRKRKTR